MSRGSTGLLGRIWSCWATHWVSCTETPNRKENLERQHLHFVYHLCSSGEEPACCVVSDMTTHSWGLGSVWPDSGSSCLPCLCHWPLAAVPQATAVPCVRANSIASAVLHLQKSRKKEDFYLPQTQGRVRGSLRLPTWGFLRGVSTHISGWDWSISTGVRLGAPCLVLALSRGILTPLLLRRARARWAEN